MQRLYMSNIYSVHYHLKHSRFFTECYASIFFYLTTSKVSINSCKTNIWSGMVFNVFQLILFEVKTEN